MEIIGMVLDPSALIFALLLSNRFYVGLSVPSLIFTLLGAGSLPVPSVIFASLLGVAVGHSISPSFMALVP
jgi:hypothetical protein